MNLRGNSHVVAFWGLVAIAVVGTGCDPESCPAGTVDHDADPTTACVTSACAPGTWTTTDNAGKVTCEACPASTYSDVDNAIACRQWTNCQPGERVVQAPTSGSDRHCRVCEAGYTTRENADRCVAWTSCPAGTHVDGGGPLADQVCVPCEEGTFTSVEDETTCTPHRVCPAGTEKTSAGTAISDTLCTPCQAGAFCEGGEAQAAACADGTWDHDLDPATVCVAQPTCGPGTFVAREGSALLPKVCTTCPVGTFTTEEDADRCRRHQGCQPGEQSGASPVSFAEGTCLACPEGTFDDDMQPDTPCVPRTICSAGTFVVDDGGATVDRLCAPCADGHYSDVVNAFACTPKSTCPQGAFVDVEGGATSDRTCAPCPVGFHSSVDNAISCHPHSTCSPGQEMQAEGDATHDRVCVPCIGAFDDDGDPTTPCVALAACPAGTFVIDDGGGTANRACAPCPSQTFSAAPNAAVCQPKTVCVAGETLVDEGDAAHDRECVPCASGSFDHDNRSFTVCQPKTTCPAGSYVVDEGNLTRDRTCAACPSGQFSMENNPATCQLHATCQPGSRFVTAGTSTSDTTCASCADGTFSSDANALMCSPLSECAVGMFVSAPGTSSQDTECTACAPGTWDDDADGRSACISHQHCFLGNAVDGTPTDDAVCAPRPLALAVGLDHSCTLFDDGALRCWGDAELLQVDGTYQPDGIVVPVDVASLVDATAVAAMATDTCFARAGAGIYCYGARYGWPPVAIANTTDVVEFDGGDWHACFVTSEQTVRCFGGNGQGRLGDGTETDNLHQSVLVTGLFDVRHVAAGARGTCAVKTDGTVWCWGDNTFGATGNGIWSGQEREPVQVVGITDAVDIAAGAAFACALLQSGQVRCWGDGRRGQLGDGTDVSRPNPTAAVLGLNDAVAIDADTDAVCALDAQGQAWCWGNPALVSGGYNSSTALVVPGTNGAVDVQVGGFHACTLYEDGDVWCWGREAEGRLGRIPTGTGAAGPVAFEERQ